MSIFRRVFTGLLPIALILSTAPRDARADDSGSGTGLAVGIAIFTGFVVADAAFAIYDVTQASKGERGSQGHAIAEIVVTVPQILILGAVSGKASGPDDLIFAAVPTALLVHGLLTLHAYHADVARAPSERWRPPSEQERPAGALKISFLPTAFPARQPGRDTVMPGVVAFGSF